MAEKIKFVTDYGLKKKSLWNFIGSLLKGHVLFCSPTASGKKPDLLWPLLPTSIYQNSQGDV